MEIDWPRRNSLMRLHFACELILVLFNRQFGNKGLNEELYQQDIDNLGIKKEGAHIGPLKARIDFSLKENISNYFPAILSEYEKIIGENRTIVTDYSDKEKQRRYWRIPGLATIPCGGTHVS